MKTAAELHRMLRERHKGNPHEQAAARAGMMHPNTARCSATSSSHARIARAPTRSPTTGRG